MSKIISLFFVFILIQANILFAQQIKTIITTMVDLKTNKPLEKYTQKEVFAPNGKPLLYHVPDYYVDIKYNYNEKMRLLKTEGTSGEGSFSDEFTYHDGFYLHKFFNGNAGEEGDKKIFENKKQLATRSSGKTCSLLEENTCYQVDEEWRYDKNDSLVYYGKKQSKMGTLMPDITFEEVETIFDNTCNKVKFHKKRLDGKLVFEKEISYRKDCQTEKIVEKYHSVINSVSTTDFFYNAKNLLEKKEVLQQLQSEKYKDITFYTYDAKNRITEERNQYFENDVASPEIKTSYIYEANNAYQKKSWQEKGFAIDKFNEKGLVIEKAFFDETNQLTEKYIYEYEFY